MQPPTTLKPHRWHGAGAQFPSASAVYAAAEKVRDRGFCRWDVHTPFPVHGMDKAMGLGKSQVSKISLLGGALGLSCAVAMEVGVSVFVYPMIVQGKPFLSLPAFVPIMFEMTILFTAFATLGGMLLLNLLPRLHHPVFNWDRFAKVTDDAFFIVIESDDPRFDETETPQFLEEIGGEHVTLIKK